MYCTVPEYRIFRNNWVPEKRGTEEEGGVKTEGMQGFSRLFDLRKNSKMLLMSLIKLRVV